MRGLVTFLAALAVIALGYWAYHQNIQTQTAIRQIDRLQMAIGVERERLSVLRAEWATVAENGVTQEELEAAAREGSRRHPSRTSSERGFRLSR